MRTIKFRAWDKRLKAMIKVTHDYQLHVRDIYWEIIDLKIGCKVLDNWRDNENGNVLMQYTGIKDKNGKEIYDGDILLSYRNTGNYIVRFDELDACFEGYGTDGEFFILEAKDFNKCEIIGNIYEHSHLLSGGQQ